MSFIVNSIASSSRSLGASLARRALTTAPGQTSSALPSSSDSPVPAAYRSPASTSSPTDLPTPSSPQTFVNPYKSSRANQVNLYKLHVFSTRNNTILTLTHSPGSSPTSINNELSSLPSPHHPVAWVSAGSAGYKGAARGTYDAAVEASLRMFKKIEELVEPPIGSGGQRRKVKSPPPTDMEVIWKGFGQGRDAVFRSLLGGEGDKVRGLVKRVTDATPLKIGGTRAKKRRVI